MDPLEAETYPIASQETTDNNLHTPSNWLKFLVPSLFGVLLFVTPLAIDGNITIPVAILAQTTHTALKSYLPLIVTICIVMGAFLSLMAIFIRPKIVCSSRFLSSLFIIEKKWLVVRILGALIAVGSLTGLGPDILISSSTGAYLLNELLPILLCVFLYAGVLLPLMINFGLIELCGNLLERVMRPLFTLPGSSSIDCLTSCVGDGTIGVLLTSKQYSEGLYTKREAAVISTSFSLVSVSFAFVVLAQVKLEHMVLEFYGTVLVSCVATAMICPRIYPLCSIADEYAGAKEIAPNATKKSRGLFKDSLHLALEKARTNSIISSIFKEGTANVLDTWFGVLPTVMCFGTLSLAAAEYTPIFRVLGQPFIPFLEYLSIPDAEAVANTICLGFADMFLPSVMISSSPSELARFVVACLSVSQLIYMSEVGSLILSSNIPVKFFDLLLIFLQRTIITLPIVAIAGQYFFGV